MVLGTGCREAAATADHRCVKTNDLVVAAGHSVDLAWVTSGENRPSDGVKKYAEQQAVKAAGDEVTVETRFLILEDLTKELLRAVTPAWGRGDGRVHPQPGNGRPDTVVAGGHQR
jgi:hypothetical protein